MGHPGTSSAAASGAARQPGATAGNAPRTWGDQATAGGAGRTALMLVVVGGHSRNIGKTSVTAGLIRKLRDRQWTAVKITQYGNSICDHHTGACGCEPESGDEFELSEEYEPNDTDSGRFLAA